MSEYQFYEFRSIDRLLSAQEQDDIAQWSSRAEPSATGISLTYHYGDFRYDPRKVLGQYFDAMFYIANWGTMRLAFRFPKHLVDLKALKAFCIFDEVSLSKHGDFVVLDMQFSNEDGYNGWVQGEGHLSNIVSLRQDILDGDYRCLYLAWLFACARAVHYDSFDIQQLEPSLPNRLLALNGALTTLVELVEFDEDLLAAAALKTKLRHARLVA